MSQLLLFGRRRLKVPFKTRCGGLGLRRSGERDCIEAIHHMHRWKHGGDGAKHRGLSQRRGISQGRFWLFENNVCVSAGFLVFAGNTVSTEP